MANVKIIAFRHGVDRGAGRPRRRRNSSTLATVPPPSSTSPQPAHILAHPPRPHPMSRARSSASDEEDLSKLYNDVLAGFADESDGGESLSSTLGPSAAFGTPGESNILSIYDAYGQGHERTMSEESAPSRPSLNGANGAHPRMTGVCARFM
ncbi:hypothetical protein K439DRAFT_345786 [Ramaria rubella]|nr:hypothetical protein K439DRAFT_345786 [Ramaria rubella]